MPTLGGMHFLFVGVDASAVRLNGVTRDHIRDHESDRDGRGRKDMLLAGDVIGSKNNGTKNAQGCSWNFTGAVGYVDVCRVSRGLGESGRAEESGGGTEAHAGQDAS